MTRRVLAALVGLLGGCAEDDGPMSRQTVAALARTSGDAIGYARTGIYDATLSEGECDCPVVSIDLIGTQSLCALDVAPQIPRSVGLVQSDGVLLLRIDPVELTGPLDADDTFSIGAVDSLSLLGGSGVRIARIDGDFDDDGVIVAEFRQRIDGDFADEKVDCEERFEVEAIPR